MTREGLKPIDGLATSTNFFFVLESRKKRKKRKKEKKETPCFPNIDIIESP
jgi:hypothetical protein